MNYHDTVNHWLAIASQYRDLPGDKLCVAGMRTFLAGVDTELQALLAVHFADARAQLALFDAARQLETAVRSRLAELEGTAS